MKKYIKLILTSVLFVLGLSLSAQIASNNSVNATINGESVFFDVSASASSNSSTKGLGFPQTNLTTFTFVSVAGSFSRFRTGYDGLLIYNIATGTTPATGAGVGGQAVTPGFYYFSNPTPTPLRSSASGEWIAIGGGAPAAITETPTTSALIGATEEKVIRLTGHADGLTTHISLAAVLGPNVIRTFRKAIIYDIGTGAVIMESTGSYDSLTNIFVTSNGMINFLLDEADYAVEVYYFAAP